jgi:hypothetical protein
VAREWRRKKAAIREDDSPSKALQRLDLCRSESIVHHERQYAIVVFFAAVYIDILSNPLATFFGTLERPDDRIRIMFDNSPFPRFRQEAPVGHPVVEREDQFK